MARKKKEVESALHCMEVISNITKHLTLDREQERQLAPYIEVICKTHGVNKEQTILLSHLMEHHGEKAVFPDDFSRWMGVTNIHMLKWRDHMSSLAHQKWVMCVEGKTGDTYQLTGSAYHAIMNDAPFLSKDLKNLTENEFFTQLHKIFRNRQVKRQVYAYMQIDLISMIVNNEKVPLIEKLSDFDTTFEEDVLFLYMCCKYYVENKPVAFLEKELKLLFDDDSYTRLMLLLRKKESQLFQLGILQEKVLLSSDSGPMKAFCLSSDIMEEIAPGVSKPAQKPKKEQEKDKHEEDPFPFLDMDEEAPMLQHIPCGNIPERNLYFDASVQQQMDTMGKMLEKKNLTKIQKRLKSHGMAPGVVCLLHGLPGTGKTSGILEMARRAKTDVYMVDISAVRSKYMGESIKNCKRIFTEYSKACKNNTNPCCLLINEADAVITRRQSNATHSSEQEENAMVNVFLQCLEDFDQGCCFLTTNLAENFDPAIERRILMKVALGASTPEQREYIWRNNFPKLTDEQVKALAQDYELSPAEIMNVVKKEEIHDVLKGKRRNLYASIRQSCESEHYAKTSRRNPIGF